MKVYCEISDIKLMGDYVRRDGTRVLIKSTAASCSECGHTTEAYGRSDASIKRCLATMRQQCPRGESNLYTDETPSRVSSTAARRTVVASQDADRGWFVSDGRKCRALVAFEMVIGGELWALTEDGDIRGDLNFHIHELPFESSTCSLISKERVA